MSKDNRRLSPGLVLWVAGRVITQHAEATDPHRATGRCKQCRPDGCAMLAWAIGTVRAERTAGHRPRWYAAGPAPIRSAS
ncbi:hypothetical protein [Plantactinospora sp. CA-290183]|uniref:hypothetical protein n=1 Tax=Plantactinospora sp. CA-290183 TaxID=3240006 RepID=UPI003D93BA7E